MDYSKLRWKLADTSQHLSTHELSIPGFDCAAHAVKGSRNWAIWQRGTIILKGQAITHIAAKREARRALIEMHQDATAAWGD